MWVGIITRLIFFISTHDQLLKRCLIITSIVNESSIKLKFYTKIIIFYSIKNEIYQYYLLI